MNDLLSPDRPAGIEMAAAAPGGADLDGFFREVETVRAGLREVQAAHQRLHDSHHQAKTLHRAQPLRELRSRMDADVALALSAARDIRLRLQALDESSAAARALPGCGPGSSADRTRTAVVGGLRKKLRDSMDAFNALRQRISSDHRDTVGRRYFTVTGENPSEETVDELISTGQSETFLQKAIQEQGRGRIMETITEIQERQEGAREMERSLKELHQVFADMAVLVEAQGEELDDIEAQVGRASSFVRGGTQQLQAARRHQKSTRKWTCFAIILLLVIVLVILLAIRPWS